MKSVQIRSFFWSIFSCIRTGLNMEIDGVNLRIHSKYRNIRTRENSVFGQLLHSAWKMPLIYKRMFTWDFISGEMKYFHFSFWSVSYNCYMTHPKMKLSLGVTWLPSFEQKQNLILRDKMSCKHNAEWNHSK